MYAIEVPCGDFLVEVGAGSGFADEGDADLEDDFVLGAEVEECASVLALRQEWASLGTASSCQVVVDL